MELLEHLINERPILFARYIGYLVIAIVSIITALIKRNKKKYAQQPQSPYRQGTTVEELYKVNGKLRCVFN